MCRVSAKINACHIVSIALEASTNQYFKRFFGTRSIICYVPKLKSFSFAAPQINPSDPSKILIPMRMVC
jgi:hypothetical protein